MKRTKPPKEKPVVLLTKSKCKKLMTNKNIKFCHEYIKDWNGTRSAIAAGYKKKHAVSSAHEITRKPYIKRYIELIQEDIAKECGISKIGLLSILKAHATTSMGDLLDNWITRKKLDELKEKHPEFVKSIHEVSTRVRQVVLNKELFEIEEVKVKLYDSQKAIDQIFKAMGWNAPEKVSLESDVTHNLGTGNVGAIREAFGLK